MGTAMYIKSSLSIAAFVVVLSLCLNTASALCSNNTYTGFTVQVGKTSQWTHYWERCVGSGHAVLALREDYRRQLTQVHKTLGIERVRFHGLLDDDMSVLTIRDGQPYYSFFNIDSIMDFLQSIGMRPIIEVSFMPEVIASGPETIFHYKGNITPPKNQTMWTDLIKTLVRHLIDRYGVNEIRQWPFEIWNEPNCGFFSGTQEQYFELMKITREAIKTVDDRIPVGGPATCQSGWINETLAYSAKHNFTLDFISTHLYPTDFGNDVPRDIMYTVLSNVRRTIGPDMPLYYTEYNSGLWCCPERQHDLPYAASFVVSNIPVLAGIADILSYWSFSDIFEEGGFDSAPYQSNYGMTTIYDIPKPVYRAFELLHWSGDTRLAVVPPTVPGNLDVLATRNTTHLQLYVTNFNTWGKPIKAARACITLTGLSYVNRSVPTATLHRIDDHSGNGIKAWEAMGSPAYPTPAQIHAMYEASMMKTSTTSYEYSGGKVSFDVEVPPHGVAHIAVPLSKVH